MQLIFEASIILMQNLRKKEITSQALLWTWIKYLNIILVCQTQQCIQKTIIYYHHVRLFTGIHILLNSKKSINVFLTLQWKNLTDSTLTKWSKLVSSLWGQTNIIYLLVHWGHNITSEVFSAKMHSTNLIMGKY